MPTENRVPDLDIPSSQGEIFPVSTQVSSILNDADDELIADLKMRIPPTETPYVALGERQYLQEGITTYYIAADLTPLLLRGLSFRDRYQSNVIFDNDGGALQLILPYTLQSEKGKKNQSDFGKIIEVSESRLGIRVISRKFGSYLVS